ncbi:MAG: transporter substrate-binding domain-containing protein [Prevotella sp.]|nr:transporter substrate-binding domain-containing protein [Alistipes senegalensis]MCM1358655.1 transporter substrate-binding domain-containing protein [Prevotella sp.]MCM1474474.1 transporter substrate-binding domain-containing protein [Muribaculaceae bacterium]
MKKILSIFSVIAMITAFGCGEKKEAQTIFSANDLTGKTIGTQIGTTGYALAGDISGAMVEKYKDAFEAVKALESKKVDAVIIDELTAEEIISDYENLTILSDPFNEEEYAIAYKKGDTELGQKLDDAITKLKRDGTISKISKHWIGSNPDHQPYEPKDVTRTGTLVMATNADFPPYEEEINGEIVGFDVDMAMAICDELGMELKIKNMDFSSIITSISFDEADIGVAGMSVTPEREEIVDFTQSYALSSQVIIVRN